MVVEDMLANASDSTLHTAWYWTSFMSNIILAVVDLSRVDRFLPSKCPTVSLFKLAGSDTVAFSPALVFRVSEGFFSL